MARTKDDLDPVGEGIRDVIGKLNRADENVDSAVLTEERKTTHGDWMQQAALAQALKKAIRVANEAREVPLQPHQMEALEMDMVKTSRILCGDPSEPDHWNDKKGYAHLGKGGRGR